MPLGLLTASEWACESPTITMRLGNFASVVLVTGVFTAVVAVVGSVVGTTNTTSVFPVSTETSRA